MKKFVAFVMILSLGVFCAIGCSKPAPKKEPPKPAAAMEKAPEGTAAPAAAEKAPEGEKAPEKK